jgi:hypothetical protein
MLLPFTDSLVITGAADCEAALLADSHYSRQTIGARQFMPNGEKMVIRDAAGLMVFGWLFQKHRKDGQNGLNCSIFKNDSGRLSSEIILECESLAVGRWGLQRMFTYVAPSKIRSANPGYCFKRAGWTIVRNEDGSIYVSPKGNILLEKFPDLCSLIPDHCSPPAVN